MLSWALPAFVRDVGLELYMKLNREKKLPNLLRSCISISVCMEHGTNLSLSLPIGMDEVFRATFS